MTIEYTVTAEFDSLQRGSEWVAWLQHGHLQAVIDGGALRARLVRHEPVDGVSRFSARYEFADMAAFSAYERGAAVALRAEGAAKFPPQAGMRMQRSLSEVLTTLG